MNLTPHLPALQVALPLAAAPLALLLRQRHLVWALMMAVSWIGFAISILLWLQVQDGSVISYAIGHWPPPWGIEYRVDALNAFVLVLISGMAALVLPYSLHSIEIELHAHQHYLFHTMFALCLAGLLGITITGDAFNIFVFLEISSLSTYVLIALSRRRQALLASFQYLVMGTIGATLIVIGIGLLYLITGSLNLTDIGQRLSGMPLSRAQLTALAFLTIGLSLKLALFPLHQWLPNAYANAPSAVSAFLAATATKVAIYVLLRFYTTVFGLPLLQSVAILPLLMLLSLAAMFVAGAIAIAQSDLKRLFAFSSVAQIGYILLGMSLGSATGMTAGVLHLFNHGITKGAIFLWLGIVAYTVGSSDLTRLRGLGRQMPIASAGLVLCGLSLIGIPGTSGFISKWQLVMAALEAQQWWLVFAILASSLLAVAYVWKFVEVAYLQAPAEGAHLQRHAGLGMTLPALVLTGATLYFGLDSRFSLGAAQAAVDAALRVGVLP
jgi:multicomponent Na+:H+ antiporter subunit D